jgi:hypothetical protein
MCKARLARPVVAWATNVSAGAPLPNAKSRYGLGRFSFLATPRDEPNFRKGSWSCENVSAEGDR